MVIEAILAILLVLSLCFNLVRGHLRAKKVKFTCPLEKGCYQTDELEELKLHLEYKHGKGDNGRQGRVEDDFLWMNKVSPSVKVRQQHSS